MKILVLGCTGIVGKAIYQRYKNDARFIFTSRNEVDVTKISEVNNSIEKIRPEYVINATGYTQVDGAEEDEFNAVLVNERACVNIAAACEKYSCCLVHISTDYVYTVDHNEYISELDKKNPKSIYGQTKLAGEEAIESICPKYYILRTSWVFGETGNSFVSKIIEKLESSESIEVVSDQVGGLTFSGDIAEVLVKICESDKNGMRHFGVYNYTGKPIVSWYGAANFIKDTLQYHGVNVECDIKPIESTKLNLRAVRPLNSKLNCGKIEKHFKIYQSDWKESVKKIALDRVKKWQR
jgi:dTDP-4-dehydrorhamnose reductase